MGRRRMRRNGIRRPVRMAVVCLLGFSLAGAAGCGRKAAPAPENARGAAGGGPDLLAMPQYPCMPDRETDWEAWRAYIDEYAVLEDECAQIRDFSFQTASALIQDRETNLVYSPVSLYYALSLAASGAGGETREELSRFLCRRDTAQADGEDAFGDTARRLYHLLSRKDSFCQLHIASSLWVSPKLPLKDAFLDTAEEQYFAEAYEADFADEKTREAMGRWVSGQTKGLITPQLAVNSDDVMHLLNTVYFYDEWTDAFSEKHTKEDRFYLENGEEISFPFMNRKFGSHGYAKGDGFIRSYLPLKSSGSMVFVLPDPGVTAGELASSPERLYEAFEGGTSHVGEVEFKVPRFQSDSRCDVKEMMQSMGYLSLFEDGDFSQMTDADGIFVSSIRQDSHISVNEKGVETASFTDLAYAGAALPDGKAEMILNRPFLYGIQDNGVWLFIGVCDVPEESGKP